MKSDKPVSFSEQQLNLIRSMMERLPDRKAALGDVIHMAIEEFGHMGPVVEQYIADLMDLPASYVHEVVTFYNMYIQEPVGRHHLMLCDNVSCMLCGAEGLVAHLKKRLGIAPGETTADGRFTLWTVECLGVCEMAPAVLVDHRFYGNLTAAKLDELIDSLE
jgi:NADH-quinone oxidoreductase subunit E